MTNNNLPIETVGDPNYTHCACCGEELDMIIYTVIRKHIQVTCENKDCPVYGHTVSAEQHKQYCEAARANK